MRVKITLACTECKQRNYNMTKEKKTHPDRMETKKYCKFWLDAIKAQFKRIIWPTKEEAARRSAVVLAVSVLLGVIIAVLDRVLLLLTDVIISL